MSQDRFLRWVNASHSLGGQAMGEQLLVVAVQGLGRLDCELIAGDALPLIPPRDRREAEIQGLQLQRRITLSYLWVLGAYELIRTLASNLTQRDPPVTPEILRSVRDARDSISRLRVPLAKTEAAKAHRATDWSFAYPAVQPGRGIAWQIGPSTFVSRRDLSDLLLDTLERMRAASSS